MLRGASSKGHKGREGGSAVIRQRHLIALVVAFLIGCAVLLVVGGSGVLADASQKKQGHSEATKEQDHAGGAPSEEDRCAGTRRNLRFQMSSWFYLTNDVPGCPKGGLLLGTDKSDPPPARAGLEGLDGDDKIRGLGGSDEIYGGRGSDVVYGGPGYDHLFSWGVYGGGDEGEGDEVLYGGADSDDLWAGNGEDTLYGGDGDDRLEALDIGMGETTPEHGGRDRLYCGEGTDKYEADSSDYVSKSCEKGQLVDTGGPPLLLLTGAALCSALMMLRYVIRSV
jgi:hypothetical protein